MSVKSVILNIEPSGVSPDRRSESFVLGGFTCPYCKGAGVFVRQTGRNVMVEDSCKVCNGRGKLQAKALVCWIPDDERVT